MEEETRRKDGNATEAKNSEISFDYIYENLVGAGGWYQWSR